MAAQSEPEECPRPSVALLCKGLSPSLLKGAMIVGDMGDDPFIDPLDIGYRL